MTVQILVYPHHFLGRNGFEPLQWIALQNAEGVETLVHPFAIADLQDEDNNVDLCLNVTGTPIKVKVAVGTVIDPRGDPNPETEVMVQK